MCEVIFDIDGVVIDILTMILDIFDILTALKDGDSY